MFDDWYKKIITFREDFLEYYIQEFGEDYRDVITKRFDSIKFCFYIDPNCIDTWIKVQIEDDYAIATHHFLTDVASLININMSDISLEYNDTLGHIKLKCKDEKTEEKVRKLFRIMSIGSGIIDDYYCYDELYSFRSLDSFKEAEGKEYQKPENELLMRRLLFLEDMGDIVIDGRPIDYLASEECKTFITSPRFNELLRKYEGIAKIALNYKKEVENRYIPLISYMNKSLTAEEQIRKKYDRMKQSEVNPEKIEEYVKQERREIASLRIINGNFSLNNCFSEDDALECILDSDFVQITDMIADDEHEKEEVTIYFCPFKSIPGFEDVDLRHEIRHALTGHVKFDNNKVEFKVGNKMEIYIDDELQDCCLIDYNEWVTQKEAINETNCAFSKGIFIISKPSLRNQNGVGRTGEYDKYLPLFEIVYNALPTKAKMSQIELSNQSLYNIISLDRLIDIEQKILNGSRFDDGLLEELHAIALELENNQYVASSDKKK